MYKKKVLFAGIVFVIMLAIAVAINFPQDNREEKIEKADVSTEIKENKEYTEIQKDKEKEAPYKTMTWDEFVKQKHEDDLGGGEE